MENLKQCRCSFFIGEKFFVPSAFCKALQINFEHVADVSCFFALAFVTMLYCIFKMKENQQDAECILHANDRFSLQAKMLSRCILPYIGQKSSKNCTKTSPNVIFFFLLEFEISSLRNENSHLKVRTLFLHRQSSLMVLPSYL